MPAPGQSWCVIRAARLLDGATGAPVENPTVVVHNNIIHGIYQGHVPEGRWPRDAHVIDLGAQTLLPGLIDAHVHLVLPGDGTPFETMVREPEGVFVAVAARNARTALDAGITTLRDCGGMRQTTFELRRAQHLGYAQLPRLHLCGQPLTISGGHCWSFGGEADGPDALRRAVRRLVKSGADYIKIMATGGGTAGTIMWRPAYSREELRAAVEEAHRLNRRVGIHSLCGEATGDALAAETDQIEHAAFLIDAAGHQKFDPAIADRLAAAKMPVTTTLCVGHYLIDALEARTDRTPADQALLDTWRRVFADTLDNGRRLRAAGVSFVAGTDAGWRFTPFNALVTEMELLREAGCSAGESIMAATSAPANAMGIGEETGTLREGMAADLIAVPGDPLADLEALRHPTIVMRQGTLVTGGSSRRTPGVVPTRSG